MWGNKVRVWGLGFRRTGYDTGMYSRYCHKVGNSNGKTETELETILLGLEFLEYASGLRVEGLRWGGRGLGPGCRVWDV